MLNFTKEIQLSKPYSHVYKTLRVFLYAFFILFFMFLGYRIIFPIRNFDVDFSKLNKLKDYDLPYLDNYQTFTSGDTELALTEDKFFLDRSVIGSFSKADVDLSVRKGATVEEASNFKITVQKSYRDLYYPEGDLISFPDNSLVEYAGNYYFISDGKARRFSSLEIVKQMGFSEEAFIEAEEKEINFFESGEEIGNVTSYPNGTVLKIENQFLEFRDGELYPFISEKAYLSHYSKLQATDTFCNDLNSCLKGKDILKVLNISNESIGFSDGTLISLDGSVFLINEGLRMPITSPTIFEAMGFSWDNITPVNSEEFSFHEKGGLLNVNDYHPNGTVFIDEETQTAYLIRDKQKHRFAGKNSFSSWTGSQNPILFSESGMQQKASCIFEDHLIIPRRYVCDLDIRQVDKSPGNTFHISIEGISPNEIRLVDAVFKRIPGKDDIKYFENIIKSRL